MVRRECIGTEGRPTLHDRPTLWMASWAATATLLYMQKPFVILCSQWCPGGLPKEHRMMRRHRRKEEVVS